MEETEGQFVRHMYHPTQAHPSTNDRISLGTCHSPYLPLPSFQSAFIPNVEIYFHALRRWNCLPLTTWSRPPYRLTIPSDALGFFDLSAFGRRLRAPRPLAYHSPRSRS